MKEPITIVRGNDFYLNVVVSRTLEDGTVEPYDLSDAYNVALKLVTASGRYAEFPCTVAGNIVSAKILSYKLGLTTYGVEITFMNDKLAKRSYECGLLKIVNCECQTNETTTSDNKYYDINLEVVTDVESVQIGKVTPVHVDDELSTESEFPVQNKVITTKINEIDATLEEKADISQLPDLSLYTTQSQLEEALTSYATTDYVDDATNNFVSNDDLSSTLSLYTTQAELEQILTSYTTETELNDALSLYTTEAELEEALSSYATTDYVDNAIAGINVDTTYFYTKTDVDTKLSYYVDNDYFNETSYTTAASLCDLDDRVTTLETSGGSESTNDLLSNDYMYFGPQYFNDSIYTDRIIRLFNLPNGTNTSHFNDYFNKIRDRWDSEYISNGGQVTVNEFYDKRYDLIFIPRSASNEIDILNRSTIRPANFPDGLTIKYYDNDTSNYPPMQFIYDNIHNECPDLYLANDTQYGEAGDLRINITVIGEDLYYDGGTRKLWDHNDGWYVSDPNGEYTYEYERFNYIAGFTWMAMVDWWEDVPSTEGSWPEGNNHIRHHNDWRVNKDIEQYKDLLVFLQFGLCDVIYLISDFGASLVNNVIITQNNVGNYVSIPAVIDDFVYNMGWWQTTSSDPDNWNHYPSESQWEQIAQNNGYQDFAALREAYGKYIYYVREE